MAAAPFHGAEDHRVLVLAPTARDAALSASLLDTAGIAADVLPSFDALLRELKRGAAAILFPEEAITAARYAQLRHLIEIQPPWSDLPIVVLTRPGVSTPGTEHLVGTLGNVTLLERPLQAGTLLSALRTAWRARQRQYQIRDYLAERMKTEESLRLADRRKDEFLATLGHELRNPLAPLVAGVELLKAARLQDARVTQLTGLMERQVRHLVRLVDDLLEVSRITRGLIAIQRQPIDLAATLRSAVDTVAPMMAADRHELIVDLTTERVTVSGDAVRLTQVFANLLANAVKYTNAPGTIWLTLGITDGRAVVTVRDNGIGIPPEHLASIFDMFTQVDRSSRRAQGGLGIGLTLVRSIVEMHGGRVGARSAGANTGSEFIVELPLIDVPADSSADAPVPRLAALRVLVVDDNEDAAETLADLLRSLGATVMAVHDGPAALEASESFRPDAVVLDIGMPDMDGFEVARRLRAVPSGRPPLLIALTGWGQDQDRVMSRAAGIDHHVVKPPDLRRLAELLNRLRPTTAPAP